MLKKLTLDVVAFSLIASSIIGCSGSSDLLQRETLLDQNWGRSYEAAKYNQILNPDAGQNLEPVMGLGGVAAENSVNKYDQSFKEKQQTEVTNILKLQ